ncbi:zeta toxin [Streptococcus pneumoniae]|nr:zeta toxin [Streptococcus pneumoniae]
MEIQDYTDSEFKHALARNLRSLTRGKKSSKQPIAILLGGQSGAGKTTIHRIKQKEFQGNIVIIDGDSFRSQHPHYLELQQEYGKDSVEYTKDFAGKMVESLVTKLSSLRYNLLIEGTLRTIDVPKETAQLLKSKGYEVQLALIATKPELSYLSTLIRYEELYAINPNQARATPKEHHDFIVNHLVDNTRQLEELAIFERIQIYQRDRSSVYDSGENTTSAAEVLQEYLFGKWSKVEEEMLKSGEERLDLFGNCKKCYTIFMETVYDKAQKLNSKNFKLLIGVKKETFQLMLEHLNSAYQIQHRKGGRPRSLPMEDQLIMTLRYLRYYPTQRLLAFDFGVGVATVNAIITWVEDTLRASGSFDLDHLEAPSAAVAIDVTESPIQRPKKTKAKIILVKRNDTP